MLYFLATIAAYWQFVEAASSKPMENVLTGVWRLQRHRSHHRAGIDAAAEKRAQRHVAIMRMRTDSSNFSRTARIALRESIRRGLFGRDRQSPVAPSRMPPCSS